MLNFSQSCHHSNTNVSVSHIKSFHQNKIEDLKKCKHCEAFFLSQITKSTNLHSASSSSSYHSTLFFMNISNIISRSCHVNKSFANKDRL